MSGGSGSAARVLEDPRGLRIHLREARVSASLRDPDAEVHHQGPTRDPLIELLDDIRKKKCLSLADLADLCGMKRQQLSRILNGKTPSPGLKTLRALCVALDLDLALILK